MFQHILIVQNFVLHTAADFLFEQKSSMFWRQQKECSILHQQNLTSNLNRAGGFQRLPDVLETTNFPTPPAQQIYLPPRFCATRVFLNKERQWRETLGTRLLFQQVILACSHNTPVETATSLRNHPD